MATIVELKKYLVTKNKSLEKYKKELAKVKSDLKDLNKKKTAAKKDPSKLKKITDSIKKKEAKIKSLETGNQSRLKQINDCTKEMRAKEKGLVDFGKSRKDFLSWYNAQLKVVSEIDKKVGKVVFELQKYCHGAEKCANTGQLAKAAVFSKESVKLMGKLKGFEKKLTTMLSKFVTKKRCATQFKRGKFWGRVIKRDSIGSQGNYQKSLRCV